MNKLNQYKKKRNFQSTNEPEDGQKKGKGNVFVIQKHDATNLHYDFRLEMGGVLKSWAVPKGPSTDPGVKRLAIETEDHPLEYADFEGNIPEDQYGGGQVIIWDRGKYVNLRAKDKKEKKDMKQSYGDGRIEVYLEGEKITGGYVLIKTGDKDDDNWLLVKMKDEQADAGRDPTRTEPKSVLSGRTIEDLKKQAKQENKEKDKKK